MCGGKQQNEMLQAVIHFLSTLQPSLLDLDQSSHYGRGRCICEENKSREDCGYAVFSAETVMLGNSFSPADCVLSCLAGKRHCALCCKQGAALSCKKSSVQMPRCFKFFFQRAGYSEGSNKASLVSCGIAEIPQVPFCQGFKL